MKKFSLQILSLFIFVGIFLHAQTPQGILSIPKVYNPGSTIPNTATPLGPNEFGFEIWLVNSGTVQFAYNAAQYGVSFNADIINGGVLTGVTLESGLPTVKQPGPPTVVLTAPIRIRFGQNTFGDGGPFIAPGDSVLIVRVKMTNTVNLPIATPDLVLRSSSPDQSAVFRYSGGTPPGTGNTGTAVQLAITRVTYENPPLPVELTSFTLTPQGRNVNIKWETKTETNTKSFDIERTANSSNDWRVVGTVSASGTSTTPKEYSFTDKNLNVGKYNYRLKIVDFDGTFEYSNIVEAEVSLPKEYAISQNYPNPFNPSTRIDYQLPFDSKITLELYAITGEKVATLINNELTAGYYTVDIDAGVLNLASGMYIYRMTALNSTGQNFVQVKQLMLTK